MEPYHEFYSLCNDYLEFVHENNFKDGWQNSSRYKKLLETFIRQLAEDDLLPETGVDWKYISEYQAWSDAHIEEYADEMNWKYISKTV